MKVTLEKGDAFEDRQAARRDFIAGQQALALVAHRTQQVGDLAMIRHDPADPLAQVMSILMRFPGVPCSLELLDERKDVLFFLTDVRKENVR